MAGCCDYGNETLNSTNIRKTFRLASSILAPQERLSSVELISYLVSYTFNQIYPVYESDLWSGLYCFPVALQPNSGLGRLIF
jgi:hypothetical protein